MGLSKIQSQPIKIIKHFYTAVIQSVVKKSFDGNF